MELEGKGRINKSISKSVEEDVGTSLNRGVRKDLVSRFHSNKELKMKKPALPATVCERKALQQKEGVHAVTGAAARK